jgi:PAS domain S-box-containing protein
MASQSAESFDSLDAVLAVAMDAMITVDEWDRVCQWNLAAETMFGYSREQALGRTVAELVIPPKAPCAPREAQASCGRRPHGHPEPAPRVEGDARRRQ